MGTRLVTGSGAPTAGMVYKLVEVDGTPVAKRSAHKESLPGAKRAVRLHRPTGTAVEEVLFPWSGQAPTEPGLETRDLLRPLVRRGEVAGDLPTLEQSRSRHLDAMVTLPWEGLALSQGDPAIRVRVVPPTA